MNAISLTDNTKNLPKFGIRPPAHLLRPERPDRELTAEKALALVNSGRLTTRDYRILQTVWMMGVCTSDQVRRLIFSELAGRSYLVKSRQRLRFLYQEYCLDRVFLSINEPAIYSLGRQGARIIQMRRKAKSTRDIHWSPGKMGERALFLQHGLEITEFAVTLAEAARARGGDLDWIGETVLTLKKVNGSRFRPDGFGVLKVQDRKLPFFLEWQRKRTDIAGKIKHYLEYQAGGSWKKGKFSYFPPLLFVTTAGDDWLRKFFETARRQMEGRNAPPEEFRVLMTNRERLEREGVFGPIWYRPGLTPAIDLAWASEGISLLESLRVEK